MVSSDRRNTIVLTAGHASAHLHRRHNVNGVTSLPARRTFRFFRNPNVHGPPPSAARCTFWPWRALVHPARTRDMANISQRSAVATLRVDDTTLRS